MPLVYKNISTHHKIPRGIKALTKKKSIIKASYLNCLKLVDRNRFMDCNLFVDRALLDPSLCKDGIVNSLGFGKKMDSFGTFMHDYAEQNSIRHVVDDGGAGGKDNT